jgi:hypothetical protein
MPDPPVRTLGADLADVQRYRELRRELVAQEAEMRTRILPREIESDTEYWADRLRDLLARYPEPSHD